MHNLVINHPKQVFANQLHAPVQVPQTSSGTIACNKTFASDKFDFYVGNTNSDAEEGEGCVCVCDVLCAFSEMENRSHAHKLSGPTCSLFIVGNFFY